MRYLLGPGGLILGVVVVVVGALLQINGAVAAVVCSTIGLGIVLILAGGGYWLVAALRHRRPRSIAA